MKTVLMCAPFSSRSGYGDHARSIFYSFYDSNKYDIKLWDVKWGDTPKNFLEMSNSKHKLILDRFLSTPEVDRQPDIYVDIRIPNEFETVGRFNIGITAGIETNAVSRKWIEGCNKMDLIIVPSQHSKASFMNTVYDKMENRPDGTQVKTGELKVQKQIEVIFEGTDDEIYKPIKIGNKTLDLEEKNIINYINTKVSEKFAFLFVGQWCQGGFGEDRKDVSKLIKIFYETFANLKKKPALILKTSGANFSIIDYKDCKRKIESIKNNFPSEWDLPNIYLLHGSLLDKEMNMLYNHPKIKCMVSLTHGEGFGRPLLEATMVGLPVIASNWSGHIDFLSNKLSSLVDGELVKVSKSVVWEDIIIPESQWFVINEHSAFENLKYAFKNEFSIKENAKSLMRENRNKFTLSKMSELINNTLDRYLENMPSNVKLKLPKLKKVSNKESNLSKLKLPKLKKVT